MTTITLTGIDERTDLEALDRLATEFIRAEFGILYSADRMGLHSRYPNGEWIDRVLERPALKQRCALHICGKAARADLYAGELNCWIPLAQRVQVNGQIDEATPFRQLCRRWPDTTFITQANERTGSGLAGIPEQNHSVLFDASGGRGLTPMEWPRPQIPQKAFGYAGGLKPENIAAEAGRISEVANPGWWVDMESGVRWRDPRTDADWFDLARAREVLEICRGLPPMGGEFWLHSVYGAIAVLGVRHGHVIGIHAGRQRVFEPSLLTGRLCMRPEGFWLEDPRGKWASLEVPMGEVQG